MSGGEWSDNATGKEIRNRIAAERAAHPEPHLNTVPYGAEPVTVPTGELEQLLSHEPVPNISGDVVKDDSGCCK